VTVIAEEDSWGASSLDRDPHVRMQSFEYLARLTLGDENRSVRWSDLVRFRVDGQPCPLIGQRGIWKPGILDLPLSLVTTPRKPGRAVPYDDEIREDETIVYRYQGTDPGAHDNVWLRELMRAHKPLIYFYGIDKGVYLPTWPVYIVQDDPRSLTVTVDLSPAAWSVHREGEAVSEPAISKRYLFVPARRRLHQTLFRHRVMRAYQKRCSICRLGHESLLDAAHIVPDADERGMATTQNGLSLCKIHHAAFDRNILGIDPELRVHVREEILEEVDGPMLEHGIKETHGQRLRVIPRARADQPSPELLHERFQVFVGA
jgi:putative restriction endonuclease